MKWIFLFLALSASALAVEPAIPLVVTVNDGSRLVGKTSVRELALESAAVGKVTVPLDRIASINCAASQQVVMATMKLANGDSLSGRLLLPSLPLKMAFAEVNVPLPSITLIQTSTAVASEPIAIKNPQEMGHKILNQARMLDAAIDQWALSKDRKDDDSIHFEAVATFLKPGTLNKEFFEGGSPKDLLGNLFLIGAFGANQVKVHPKTKAALKNAQIDWGTY